MQLNGLHHIWWCQRYVLQVGVQGDMFSLAEWLSHRVRPVSHSYNAFLLWSVGCRYRREPGFIGLWRILFVLQDDFDPQRPLPDNDLLQQSERSHGSSRPRTLSGKWAEGTHKIAQGNFHVRGKYILTFTIFAFSTNEFLNEVLFPQKELKLNMYLIYIDPRTHFKRTKVSSCLCTLV